MLDHALEEIARIQREASASAAAGQDVSRSAWPMIIMRTPKGWTGFHLVADVIDRVPALGARAAHIRQLMIDERLRVRAYTREHGEDPPEISDWVWPY